MLNIIKYLFKDEEGQGQIEYALIVSLIAISLIFALELLRNGIGESYNNTSTEL
jgi:Flp pilus assembly pilin Flp